MTTRLKRTKKYHCTLLFVLISTLFFTGCGKSPEEKLLGKWEEVDGSEKVEYFADGTVVFSEDADGEDNLLGGLSISGTWSFLDDGRLKVEVSFLGIPMVFVGEIEFEGDEYVFTQTEDGEEDVDRYRRDKSDE